MIVWLNGAFGAGKTTTSGRLVTLSARLRAFDPEWVGYLLATNLADHEVSDFQHYPSWRRLVPVVADELVRVTGQHLVAAQSVLVEEYWQEIRAGLAGLGHDVFHVVLDADAQTLHARIDADQEQPERIRPWRHRHVDAYQTALDWLAPSADLVIDTGTHGAADAARQIHLAVAPRL
ncbi:ATP-binding protein [Nocardioides pantholopis]|uniref:ATP-binding protein n=1 Tax=Nocardioides pantholopis TaxID=2483798 RepID=UPI000FDB0261|nr:ATP-binding protein [Nocardioides pantholopis]